MKFLLDESVSPLVKQPLVAAGHDVVHLHDLGLRGAPDPAVVDAAAGAGRVLVTLDTDFGELVARAGSHLPSMPAAVFAVSSSSPVDEERARTAFADAVALWAAAALPPDAVVEAACDALVAGWDSDALAIVAGMPQGVSSFDLEDALPPAMVELGLVFDPPRTAPARLRAARLMAQRCLEGDLAPRDLVRWMHQTFIHGQDEDLEPFLQLDDSYDIIEYTARAVASLDSEVVETARRFVDG